MQYDEPVEKITEYALAERVFSDEALSTARYTLFDSLGCSLLALNYPACTKLLGPHVEGSYISRGSRVPGTSHVLDPVKAAFDIGTSIRWLDFNDTWLAAEWGHPSDNYGAILSVADHVSRNGSKDARPTMHDILRAAIKAYEIQGVLALDNSFNRVGIDHVLLVKVASAAVTTAMLGGTADQVASAVSNAWLDATLRTYRHAPNTGSRKSWAAGDACARAVQLAFMAVKGEMGYRSALSAPAWGFQDTWFGGKVVRLSQPLDDYVMENILFKISFPAEFHAQTAIEAAFQLHPEVDDRLDEIDRVEITTQEPAIRIIDKKGPLTNPADRDHCIQYMTAIGLLKGSLTAMDYEDAAASDPRIDQLRSKMVVREDQRYTREYLDPSLRSIANSVQVFFSSGDSTRKVEVEYPVGHRRRRSEALSMLRDKFESNLDSRFDDDRSARLLGLFDDPQRLMGLPADEFIELFCM